MVIVGGHGNSGHIKTAEEFSLYPEPKQCPNKAFRDYARPSGGLLKDEIALICGGIVKDGGKTPVGDCFSYSTNNQVTQLLAPRVGAASVVIEAGRTLWIAGGKIKNSALTKSTEFIFINSPSLAGPDMPDMLMGHCLTHIDSSRTFLIGGSGRTSVWNFSFINQKWTAAPDLIIGRSGHVCGHIRDSTIGNLLVIAAGGTPKDCPASGRVHGSCPYTDTAEILDLDSAKSNDKWITISSLPATPASAIGLSVFDGKEFWVVGGFTAVLINWKHKLSDEMYRLTCANTDCKWNLAPIKLSFPRGAFSAFLVPDSMSSCPAEPENNGQKKIPSKAMRGNQHILPLS